MNIAIFSKVVFDEVVESSNQVITDSVLKRSRLNKVIEIADFIVETMIISKSDLYSLPDLPKTCILDMTVITHNPRYR